MIVQTPKASASTSVEDSREAREGAGSPPSFFDFQVDGYTAAQKPWGIHLGRFVVRLAVRSGIIGQERGHSLSGFAPLRQKWLFSLERLIC